MFYLKIVFIPPKAREKGMKADLDTTKTDVIAPFLSMQKYRLRSRGWEVKVFLLKTDYSIKRSLSWSSGQIFWVLS